MGKGLTSVTQTWETPMVGLNTSDTNPFPQVFLSVSEVPEDGDCRGHLVLAWPTAAFQPLCICSSQLGNNWCPPGSLDRCGHTRTHIYTQVHVGCRKEQSQHPTVGSEQSPKRKKRRKVKKKKAVQGAILGQESSRSGYSQLHQAEHSSFKVLCKSDCPIAPCGAHSVISRHPPRGCWLHTSLCF